MTDFISVDVEASGPIPGDYSLLEIGACKVDDINNSFYALLKPINGIYTDSAIRVLGKEDLQYYHENGEEPEKVMKDFAKWLGYNVERFPVFVGYNARFDSMFCDWYFWHFLGTNPFGTGSALDIRSFAMAALKCKWYETTKKHLKSKFRTQHKHTHKALQDSQEQAELFQRLLEYNRETKHDG